MNLEKIYRFQLFKINNNNLLIVQLAIRNYKMMIHLFIDLKIIMIVTVNIN